MLSSLRHPSQDYAPGSRADAGEKLDLSRTTRELLMAVCITKFGFVDEKARGAACHEVGLAYNMAKGASAGS